MKLWKKPHMMEHYDPCCEGQNGWNVYCKVGDTIMVHWFSSPSKEFDGCLKYLDDKGYFKVNTQKRLLEFKKLWKELFLEENVEVKNKDIEKEKVMLKPVVVTDVDLAFGGKMDVLLPPLKDIPEEFKKGKTKWNTFIETMFYHGLKSLEFETKEGIDPNVAFRHIRAVLKSWEPKHEHKMAGCAYLASEFFTDVKYS